MITVPVSSCGSLRGLPQKLTLQVNGRNNSGTVRCVRDIRGKLTELTGNHKCVAGLIYRGCDLADDVPLEGTFACQAGATDATTNQPRVLVYEQLESRQPFHFFRTREGCTMTIDEREDERLRWARAARGSTLEDQGHGPIEACIRQSRAMAPELQEWLTKAEETAVHAGGGGAGGEEKEQEEVLVETDALTVGTVPVHRYTNLASDLHLAVVGGVHGNELTGMEGAQCIHEFLSARSHDLALAIQERANVTVIPCVNSVGLAAGARCAPTLDTPVLRGEWSRRRVYVGDHQHGSFFPPGGWQDPNRGWSSNRTVVKYTLERALFSGAALAPPSMVVWNHDWAIPNGVCIARGAPNKELYEKPMRAIFGKHYPTRTGFGKTYEHVITVEQDAAAKLEEADGDVSDWKYMPDALQNIFNHADYTIESYCAGDAVELHFEATLYLLARHSHVPLGDTELLAAVADATRETFARKRAGGGVVRHFTSPSPLGPV